MDFMKNKDQKKLPVLKKLFLSLKFRKSSTGPVGNFLRKCKSCHQIASNKDGDYRKKKRGQVAPEGCFSVYVGVEEEQKFVLRTEYANHPLFKMLLEDAEMEYGFSSEGPIKLPCDVHLFHKVLAEMDKDEDDEIIQTSFGFVCSPFTPTRLLGNGGGYGSYGVLTPSRLLRRNHF